MADRLFGMDIAGMVRDGLNQAGGVLKITLIKVTAGSRSTGALSAGTNPSEASYPCEGFDSTEQKREAGLLSSKTVRSISIVGASLEKYGVVPAVNDKITIDGETLRIDQPVGTDPARALYECEVVS